MIEHIQHLLNSYQKAVGKELIERISPEKDALTIQNAPFVVVSHGTQEDPVLNYGNQTDLNLWEMSWDDFTQTPSKYTAEPERQERRKEMLEQAAQKGYIDDYEGIRISSTGKRFEIKDVVIWNVFDKEIQTQSKDGVGIASSWWLGSDRRTD